MERIVNAFILVLKKIRSKIKVRINRIGSKKRLKKLKNKNITIISNNCYAGLKYENIGLPFLSPTIGLYFFAEDYIKFISNLKHYILECNLKIIKTSESKYYDYLVEKGQQEKIVGRLDDVEIVFLHYDNENDVIEKWNKRCKRINWDNIIYKFNDQNLCDYKHLEAFHNLKLDNKICFTAKKYSEFPEFIQIKKYKNKSYVKDDVFFNNKYLNFIDYANKIKTKNNNIPVTIFHVFNKMHMGGAETMIMNHYRCLDTNKFKFNFIVNHPGPYDNEIKQLGGQIYYIPEYNLFNHFKYVKEINKILSKNINIDLLEVHTRGFSSIILKLAKKRGITTISHCHSVSNGTGIIPLIKRIIELRIKFFADYYFACSNDAAKWLFGKKRANSNKCFIVKNAIDVKKFKYSKENRDIIRKKHNINDNTIVIGQVGRLVPVKNYKFSIDLLSELLKTNNNIIMMFCGDGEQKKGLEEYAYNREVNNRIIFVNQTKEINLYYNAFDYLICPSLYESLGMTLIEGQFSGLNCFASIGVSRESKISNKIKYLPLNLNIWKNEILNCKNERKESLTAESEKYDVIINTKLLQNIYLKIINR